MMRPYLRDWRKGQTVSARRMNDIQRAIPRFAQGSDVRMVDSAIGTLLRTDRSEPRPKQWFWAQIVNAIPNGVRRWNYQFAELVKVGPGFDGWQVRTGGRTGDCYNLLEVVNGDPTGPHGNGIDPDNLPSGFDYQPVPIGVPVQMHVVRYREIDNGSVAYVGTEYWFYGYNAVDGACQ